MGDDDESDNDNDGYDQGYDDDDESDNDNDGYDQGYDDDDDCNCYDDNDLVLFLIFTYHLSLTLSLPGLMMRRTRTLLIHLI